MSRPPKGMIALWFKQFESSLTLPFPKTIQVILHLLGLAPGQLNPTFRKLRQVVSFYGKERTLARLVLRSSITVTS